jgi:hypothetical protein
LGAPVAFGRRHPLHPVQPPSADTQQVNACFLAHSRFGMSCFTQICSTSRAALHRVCASTTALSLEGTLFLPSCSPCNRARLQTRRHLPCSPFHLFPLQVTCHHLSVSSGCFSQIERCPVCRSTFSGYLCKEQSAATSNSSMIA